ncbi:MAG: hypothetical protein WAO58_05250 [Fimbriimonadaceae bacterium]
MAMTASELIRHQVDELGYQLSKVFEGIPASGQDFKAIPSAMSPREILAHLCEAYMAFDAHGRGEEFQWGSFKPDPSWEGLYAQFVAARNTATARAVSSEDEKALKSAHDYLVGHDAYHVGQMASCRIAMDPEWNAYGIYREE